MAPAAKASPDTGTPALDMFNLQRNELGGGKLLGKLHIRPTMHDLVKAGSQLGGGVSLSYPSHVHRLLRQLVKSSGGPPSCNFLWLTLSAPNTRPL